MMTFTEIEEQFARIPSARLLEELVRLIDRGLATESRSVYRLSQRGREYLELFREA
jgi:predicted transcriptional regulator